jgi:hypothetical protein
MMSLVGLKRRCGRRNPRLAASLGLLSAMMLAGSAFLERYEGRHAPLILAGMVCILLVALALIRLVVLNRDGNA